MLTSWASLHNNVAVYSVTFADCVLKPLAHKALRLAALQRQGIYPEPTWRRLPGSTTRHLDYAARHWHPCRSTVDLSSRRISVGSSTTLSRFNSSMTTMIRGGQGDHDTWHPTAPTILASPATNTRRKFEISVGLPDFDIWPFCPKMLLSVSRSTGNICVVFEASIRPSSFLNLWAQRVGQTDGHTAAAIRNAAARIEGGKYTLL